LKQAVILAGGKGTRLSDRLAGLPKPLVDFCGKPLLGHQIDILKRYGYTHILILVNHKANKIEEYIKANNSWGVDIECINENEPKGTAGAVLSVFNRLKNTFLVVYGDTIFDVDLVRFEKFHSIVDQTDISLFLHPNSHPYDSDLVEINESGKVLGFKSYPHPKKVDYRNIVNAALYLINRECLTPDLTSEIVFADFAKDLFPQLLDKGFLLRGYLSPEYIKDCGTPERLDKAIEDYKSGKISNSNIRIPQAAVFLDRDGTINQDSGHLSDVKDLVLFHGVCEAIRKINDAGYKCIVVTNQPVIARGECSLSELQKIHNKLETILGQQGAFFDRIYYCPHHPDSGFKNEVVELKGPCECRKPSIAMINSAVEEFNIDLSRSWFIGDTTVDLMTAKNAGIRSILVKTGAAGRDGKYDVIPDVEMADLTSAVDFLLNAD
jgi:histidinol-phosphate phosphatase family protein